MSQHAPEHSDATLIHIYGTDRSGSTMLDLILGNATDAFSCGEVSAWFRPYRKHHFQIECLCGQNPCPVWEKVKDMPESIFHTTMAKQLKVRYVIDSSKDICWLIDAQKWASDNGLQTANLLIWKDPIDLAYSYWKRGEEAISWRKAFVKCYGWVFQIGLPFISIQYDDLVHDPPLVIEKLCNALGMSYFEGKVRFSEKQSHHLFGSTGIRAQAGSRNSSIENKKVYLKEFEEQRDKLQKQLARDQQAQGIIRILRQADILCRAPENIYTTNYASPRILPTWYYRKKLIRSFRRYFPEHYQSSAMREVETVPVKHSP